MFNEAERKNLKIGFKEVMSVISKNCAARVVIAENCDDKIKVPLLQAAKETGVQAEYVETTKALGKLCGIDVGASCAAVVKF